jgi:serine phosphatase RsbU (regulator of sigma subunit)
MTKPLRFTGLIALLFFFSSSQIFAQVQNDFVEAFTLAIKSKDYNKASLHAYEAGKIFYETGDATNAEKYLKESVLNARRSNASTQQLLSTHLLATVLFTRKNYSDAADQFSEAAALAQKVNSPKVAMESLLMAASALGNLKRYKKGIDPLNEALAISIENKFTEGQLSCYKLLSEFYQNSGNEKKAVEFANLYQTLNTLHEKEKIAAQQVSDLQNEKLKAQELVDQEKQKLKQAKVILSGKEDSLQNATQSLRLAEESLKDLEETNHRRQLEIDLLNKEKELSNLRIQEQGSRLENEALLRNFILAVIFLGLTLAVVIVINNRKTVAINKRLDLQNKNIKSSINYAKRIQEAMLPKKEMQEKFLPESFILFKPRDVVSGDFYWFSPIQNGEHDLAFGAIDCTGHGVPGALMSMIGINALNSIVTRGIAHTDAMLDSLHQEIRTALQQELTGNNDGMDASLCVYRRKQKTLEFAGAKSPLVYIQNGEVFHIKGDLHPIGGSRTRHQVKFRKHDIVIDQDTTVYLFTDGFRDQFGGSENQKFMSKRFTQLLLEVHKLPMEEQKQKLEEVFTEWKGKNEQTDDVLIIGVKLKS